MIGHETTAAEVPPQEIKFVWVDHRDGEQQVKRYENMPVPDRIEVFDAFVEAGMRQAEIGHLGNPNDMEFAEALVEHIADKEAGGDERYGEVKLQVLFGSQPELIEAGLDALGDFPKDRTVVHVYDRVSSHLRNLVDPHEDPPKVPKTVEESADAVIYASNLAYEAGFRNFSISGEGAVNHQDDIDEVIGYYRRIAGSLAAMDVDSINVNLANTFGLSPEGQWDREGLHYFNEQVKDFDTEILITTTIHAHNDANSAVEFGLVGLEEGFDGIEGAYFGMGERPGNSAIVDTMVRLLEKARVAVESAERPPTARNIGKMTTAMAFWEQHSLPAAIVSNLENWYPAAVRVATIYDTLQRFEKTSVGNPNAYDAGCGPHGQANEIFDIDPGGKPLWQNYGMSALIHAMMGRPEAIDIIQVNRERIREITKKTHAAGGSTDRVISGELRSEPASEAERRKSEVMARVLMARIISAVSADYETSPSLETGQLQPV